ncbi:SH3 domain-containing protein, partial [Sediminibacillus terrae]|uniref:SH3 domain-containing protein n=1 Tax=Sediminibacillus terrae TaxID=1562106 RepID=UPI0012955D5B
KIEKGEKFPIATDYGNWWRVLYSDQVGYVHKDSVKAEFKNGDDYFRVFTDNLPVYDNRGSTLKKIGELTKGQTYPIVKDYGDNWWQIQFGNNYGYVRKSDTGYATKKEVPNLNYEYSNSDSNLVTKGKVTVYDNMSGNLVAFAKLEAETIFPIATDYGNWWRVILAERVGYVKKEEVDIFGISKTIYDLTLEKAIELQMKVNPQTDQNYGYVSKSYINSKNEVTASALNVRGGPGTNYKEIGMLYNGDKVSILGEYDGWYQIKFNGNAQWVTASEEDVQYYLDPNNFLENSRQKFQFLDLGKASGATASELNSYLSGKGILSGKGQYFIEASKTHGVNDVYLVSHASLETGNGGAPLATGVEVGKDKSGNLVLVNSSNRSSLRDIRTTYNMYGIGAVDGNAYEGGAFRAYKEGWFSPEEAIIGGAQFIGNSYIKVGQNTLYKMRWNPDAMERYGYATHQYASDIGWAYKQVGSMYNLYQEIGLTTLYLDIPVYN